MTEIWGHRLVRSLIVPPPLPFGSSSLSRRPRNPPPKPSARPTAPLSTVPSFTMRRIISTSKCRGRLRIWRRCSRGCANLRRCYRRRSGTFCFLSQPKERLTLLPPRQLLFRRSRIHYRHLRLNRDLPSWSPRSRNLHLAAPPLHLPLAIFLHRLTAPHPPPPPAPLPRRLRLFLSLLCPPLPLSRPLRRPQETRSCVPHVRNHRAEGDGSCEEGFEAG